MRRTLLLLGFGSKNTTSTTGGVNGTRTDTKSAMESLVAMWSGREILSLVVISLTLQLFLLFTGNLRRRKINMVLKLIVWLAFLGADSVAVYAIGLFSRYEEKYKLRSHTPGDVLPFVWAPFLLVHLGGQDTITAFSIEDNNLWLRHLLVLIIQVIIVLYVFWKSIDLIEFKLIAIAVLVFVAAIIKYVERIWALYQGSRDSLANPSKNGRQSRWTNPLPEQISGHTMASYALYTVFNGKGLFAGRTLLQLGGVIENALVAGFIHFSGRSEIQLKVVEMELGMMYDLLYSKAMVLQSWTGRMFRFVSQVSILAAFAVFWATKKHAHNRGNVAITYMLFTGAIFIEASSVCMVIASPWTWAHFKEGNFLSWLSRSWAFKDMQRGRQRAGCSMGQYNLTDSAYLTKKSILLNLVSKVVCSSGLEKRWRNIWHIEHIEDKEIIQGIFGTFIQGIFDRYSFMEQEISPELNFVLCLPFEHALFRLHIFTDLHISRHQEKVAGQMLSGTARECKILSNYMMYLMAVHPSMLSVSSAAQDIEAPFNGWVRCNYSSTETTKLEILEKYADEWLVTHERYLASPFKTNPMTSLDYIREVWVRLLMYAAARCPGEEHARQLANGGEALTSVWALLMHHDVGSVGSHELNLLTSHDTRGTRLVSADNSNWVAGRRPIYAFKLSDDSQPQEKAAAAQADGTAPPDGFMRDARVTHEKTHPTAAQAARAPAIVDASDKGKNVVEASDKGKNVVRVSMNIEDEKQ